jgi:hypothetical protein
VIVSLPLTEAQARVVGPLLAAQGIKQDLAIFGIFSSSYDTKSGGSAMSAQLCPVGWKAGQRIATLLRKEQKEMLNLDMMVTKGKTARACKGVLYGVEGIGKTKLAGQLPGAIIIDTERGTDHEDVARIPVTTPEAFEAAIDALLNEKHDYKTVVIDTVDWLESILEAKVCAAAGQKTIEGFGYGKGYKILREEFAKLLFKLERFIDQGINIILIGHSQVKRLNPPDATEGYDRYQLKLDASNAERLKEWADWVLFVNWKTTVKQNEVGKVTATGGKERVLYTQHAAAYDAKNRAGLGEKLPFTLEAIAPLFGFAAPASNPPGQTPAAPEPPAKEPALWPAFFAISNDCDQDKLFGFLIERKALAPGQPLAQLTETFVRKVIDNPAGFKQAVANYGNDKSKAAHLSA